MNLIHGLRLTPTDEPSQVMDSPEVTSDVDTSVPADIEDGSMPSTSDMPEQAKITTAAKTIHYDLSKDLETTGSDAHESLMQTHEKVLTAITAGSCNAWSEQGRLYSEDVTKIKSFAESFDAAMTSAVSVFESAAHAQTDLQKGSEAAEADTVAVSMLNDKQHLLPRSEALEKLGLFDLPQIGFLQASEGFALLVAELNAAKAQTLQIIALHQELIASIESIYDGSASVATDMKCPRTNTLSPLAESSPSPLPSLDSVTHDSPVAKEALTAASNVQALMLKGVQIKDSIKLAKALLVKAEASLASVREFHANQVAISRDETFLSEITGTLAKIPAVSEESTDKLKQMMALVDATKTDMAEVASSFSSVLELEFSTPRLFEFFNSIFTI